ncbi:trehalose-phosphatase [Prosthecobacter sp.]|uniref:trehalose-phosphatase n=1 Tax=Prosthecobacter sp. TaxID=1965333 RepID=UPI003784F5C7
MIPHWTEQREALRHWLLTQPHIMIGCDFDGTLAPLVSHADDACMAERTRAAVQRLIAKPGVMFALISGRSIADLQQKASVDGALYAGNHGLEIAYEGVTTVAPGTAEAGPALRAVLEQLAPAMARIPGVWIEDKTCSASIHFRLAADDAHAEVEERVRAALREVAALRLRPAKRIWEIRPATEWDKGKALRWFMERCEIPTRAAAFLGDDITDLDAFRELPDGWTFLVGDEVKCDARAWLRDPEDTAELLEWMAGVRG